MTGPGARLFLDLEGERFDAAHPGGTDRVGADLEGPAGTFRELPQPGEGRGRRVGIEAEAADARQRRAVGEHLSQLVVGRRFDDGEVDRESGHGAGRGKGGARVSARGGEAMRHPAREESRDRGDGEAVLVGSRRIE